MSMKNRATNLIEQSDLSSSSLSSSPSSSSPSSSSINAALFTHWSHLPFNSEFLMNSLVNSAPLNYLSSPTYNNGLNFPILNPITTQSMQLNNTKAAFESAFKNMNSFGSFNAKNRSLINSSSTSSGYSTSDDNNDSIKTECESKGKTFSLIFSINHQFQKTLFI